MDVFLQTALGIFKHIFLLSHALIYWIVWVSLSLSLSLSTLFLLPLFVCTTQPWNSVSLLLTEWVAAAAVLYWLSTHRDLSYGDLKWTLKWILVHIHSIIRHFHCLFVNCLYFLTRYCNICFVCYFFIIGQIPA